MSKAQQARRIAKQWPYLLALQPKHIQRLWSRVGTPRALTPAFPACDHDAPDCNCAGARANRAHAAALDPYREQFDSLTRQHGKGAVFAAIGGIL